MVDDVSFAVPQGEVFGFLGPNGAGKTTTIALLLGLIRPTSGQTTILGHSVQQAPQEALRHVGAMVEYPAFYPYLSGFDNLRVLATMTNLANAQSRIEEVLRIVELQDDAKRKFKTYSQGMKQRLAIAAALLDNPEVIILDEPTNGLDPAGMVEIRQLITALAKEGHTIFLSSHLLHEVEQICHRVAILKEGRVLAEGVVDELLKRGQAIRLRVASDPDTARSVLQSVEWVSNIRSLSPNDTANDTAAAQSEESMQTAGETADDGGETVFLVDAPGDRTSELNAILTKEGISVAEIGTHDVSLEEFFLQITDTSSCGT